MDENRKSLAYSVVFKVGTRLLQMFEARDKKLISREEKGYLDFVSDADKEANEIIISEIKIHSPKDDILSEELAEAEIEKRTNYRWIIDPLDGTHNFLTGLKEWGILLALAKRSQIIYGICYFPALGEIFTAEKGKGAFLNGKKIEVSKATDLRGQMFCSDGILRKKPKEILGDIKRFCEAGCRLRVYGSSPYAFTRVALGQALIATNRMGKAWDIAAVALLVEEAGGKITDEKGNPWQIDSENLIATNGILHEQALELFRPIDYARTYKLLLSDEEIKKEVV